MLNNSEKSTYVIYSDIDASCCPGVCGTTASIQFSPRHSGPEADGTRSNCAGDDPYAGHAPYRNDVRGYRLFLESMERVILFLIRYISSFTGIDCPGHFLCRCGRVGINGSD